MRYILFKIYITIFPLWIVDILFRPKLTDKKARLYETIYGHCPFCGNLTCNGYCTQGS